MTFRINYSDRTRIFELVDNLKELFVLKRFLEAYYSYHQMGDYSDMNGVYIKVLQLMIRDLDFLSDSSKEKLVQILELIDTRIIPFIEKYMVNGELKEELVESILLEYYQFVGKEI